MERRISDVFVLSASIISAGTFAPEPLFRTVTGLPVSTWPHSIGKRCLSVCCIDLYNSLRNCLSSNTHYTTYLKASSLAALEDDFASLVRADSIRNGLRRHSDGV